MGIMGLTLILLFFAAGITIDPSGVSFGPDRSAAYSEYQALVRMFGTDDAILLAVRHHAAIDDPGLLQKIREVRHRLSAADGVLEVIDMDALSSLEFLSVIGKAPVRDKQFFNRLRAIVPGFSHLVSADMSVIGFLIRIDGRVLNGFEFERKLTAMKHTVSRIFGQDTVCHAAGIPVLKSAFERYNLSSAAVFGSLGLVFGSLVAFYIFKTVNAGLLVLLSSLCSAIWTLGIMGIFHIPVNLATGLSFGFILIASATTAFHLISRFMALSGELPPESALEKTVSELFRPSFMCAVTTAAGFFCLTFSPVKMVHQAGIIISSGVMLSFFITLTISIALLPRYFAPPAGRPEKTGNDLLARLIRNGLAAGFRKPRLMALAALLTGIFLLSGIPGIQTVRHLSTPMISHTREAADMAFISTHLTGGYAFSLVIRSKDSRVYSRPFWYDLYLLEKKLASFDGIRKVDSLTPLVFHLAGTMTPAGIRPELVFRQIQSRAESPDGRNHLASYFHAPSHTLRLIIHIDNQSSDQTESVLAFVRSQAENRLGRHADITLSGQMILLRSQTSHLVRSQLTTLLLALAVITLLMIIQLRSVFLGLLSLIPNIFPMITIFGIMGWFGIPLDPLTIFAAAISFGLSVDDSIHYLVGLKRQLNRTGPSISLVACMEAAFHDTARALVSTTAVLFLSAAGLLFSSFQHVFSLGILILSAALTALMGDLIFLPAIVLTITPVYRLLSAAFNRKAEPS